MNSLSWFIYFANVLPVFVVTVNYIISIIIAGAIVLLIITAMNYDMESHYRNKSDGHIKWINSGGLIGGFIRTAKKLWFLPIIVILTSLIPSEETFYLIAGSEASEAVVTSEFGQEILTDIREVIKIQLQSLKVPK